MLNFLVKEVGMCEIDPCESDEIAIVTISENWIESKRQRELSSQSEFNKLLRANMHTLLKGVGDTQTDSILRHICIV